MDWLTITVVRNGSEYDLEIKKPQVNRRFASKLALTEYIASKFTMSVGEALQILKDADNGGVVFALPILPENVALL